jgi:hypothetical protein
MSFQGILFLCLSIMIHLLWFPQMSYVLGHGWYWDLHSEDICKWEQFHFYKKGLGMLPMGCQPNFDSHLFLVPQVTPIFWSPQVSDLGPGSSGWSCRGLIHDWFPGVPCRVRPFFPSLFPIRGFILSGSVSGPLHICIVIKWFLNYALFQTAWILGTTENITGLLVFLLLG